MNMNVIHFDPFLAAILYPRQGTFASIAVRSRQGLTPQITVNTQTDLVTMKHPLHIPPLI